MPVGYEIINRSALNCNSLQGTMATLPALVVTP